MTSLAMGAAGTKRAGGGLGSLAAWHIAMTLLIMVEFILLQAVAVGITSVIYWLIPALDAGATASFADWRKVFQVVSPTVTVSGGAGIVLSSIIYARQAQQERQRADEAQAMAQAARTEATTALANEQAALAEAERLRARLAELENGKGDE